MADDTDAPNPFAFPVSPEIWETHPDFQGMTLRDWFAGQALAAMPKLGDTDAGVAGIAHVAFLIADAMLVARQK